MNARLAYEEISSHASEHRSRQRTKVAAANAAVGHDAQVLADRADHLFCLVCQRACWRENKRLASAKDQLFRHAGTRQIAMCFKQLLIQGSGRVTQDLLSQQKHCTSCHCLKVPCKGLHGDAMLML